MLLEDTKGGLLGLCRTVPEDVLYQAAASPVPRESSSGPAALSSSAEGAVSPAQGYRDWHLTNAGSAMPSSRQQGQGASPLSLKKAGGSLGYKVLP